jgi:hypothetical protein
MRGSRRPTRTSGWRRSWRATPSITGVIAIPTETAARDAWDALPAPVRAEAIRLAALGEAHPDPAVAAVVVGRIRTDNAVRERIFVCFSAAASAVALGSSSAFLLGSPMPLGPRLLATTGVLAALLLPSIVTMYVVNRRLAGPDPIGEVPNLGAVLPAQGVPSALVVRRRRRSLWWYAATAVAAAAIALLDLHRLGVAVEWEDLPSRLAPLALFLLLSLVMNAVSRRRRGKEPGRPVRLPIHIDTAGLRFGRLPAVPWSDVVDVTLIGPKPHAATKPAVLVWTFRDRPSARLALDEVDTPPEAILVAVGGHLVLTPTA